MFRRPRGMPTPARVGRCLPTRQGPEGYETATVEPMEDTEMDSPDTEGPIPLLVGFRGTHVPGDASILIGLQVARTEEQFRTRQFDLVPVYMTPELATALAANLLKLAKDAPPAIEEGTPH